jgi:hypothetical protein
MPKSKTHFEQIPLKLVEKIAKLELPGGKPVAPRRKAKPKAQRIASAKKRALPRFFLLEKDGTVRDRDVTGAQRFGLTVETSL